MASQPQGLLLTTRAVRAFCNLLVNPSSLAVALPIIPPALALYLTVRLALLSRHQRMHLVLAHMLLPLPRSPATCLCILQMPHRLSLLMPVAQASIHRRHMAQLPVVSQSTAPGASTLRSPHQADFPLNHRRNRLAAAPPPDPSPAAAEFSLHHHRVRSSLLGNAWYAVLDDLNDGFEDNVVMSIENQDLAWRRYHFGEMGHVVFSRP